MAKKEAPKKTKYKAIVYQSKADKQWYWKLRPWHGGHTVADSGGYNDRETVEAYLKRAKWLDKLHVTIVVVKEPV